MKHLSEYSREDILRCIGEVIELTEIQSNKSTEELRTLLNDLITDGDAPTLEEITKVLK